MGFDGAGAQGGFFGGGCEWIIWIIVIIIIFTCFCGHGRDGCR